jgi:hypothetical protein
MRTVIFLILSLFLLNESIQAQKDTIIFVDSPIRPVRRIKYRLYDFKNNLTVSMTNSDIIKKYGEPAKNIGSGLLIYVYELDDSTEVWIGTSGKKILFAKLMDANHHLKETLDLKPDPEKIAP